MVSNWIGTVVRYLLTIRLTDLLDMLTRELSPINWDGSSDSIRNQVRGLIPWPCAEAELQGKKFKLFRTVPGGKTSATPGTILSAGKAGIEVACGDGRSLYLTELQAEGGKRMTAADYLRGHPITV